MDSPTTPPGDQQPPEYDSEHAPHGPDMESPYGDNPGPAWDLRGSWGLRFVATVVQMVLQPMRTFESEPPALPRSHVQPLIFLIVATLPFALLGKVLELSISGSLPRIFNADGLIFLVLAAIALPLLYLGTCYLSALLMHLGLVVFRINRAEFNDTFRVTAYSHAVHPLYVIPYVGSLIAGLWSMVITILGCIAVHRGREEGTEGLIILALLMFPVAFVALVIILWIIFFKSLT